MTLKILVNDNQKSLVYSKSVKELIGKIKRFNEQRDWEKFHSARNLATSICLEAAEVLEKFQWKTNDKLSEKEIGEIKDEVADVLIYTLQLYEKLEIDLYKAAHEKIDKNAIKYPVEKARGKSTKYTKL